MANYTALKTAIQAAIYENGNNEITGAVLQQTLLSMITSLGDGYQFMGVATSSTNPGTPDEKVFYLGGAGRYPNFGNLNIEDGAIGVMKWDGAWILETIDGLGGANLTGYVAVESLSDLPSIGEETLGYLIGENLYLYVGNGGDVLNGKYKNCGPFRGPQGLPGENGTNGTNGTDGTDGKSAYQIWLDAGNVGTEADFLASLQGNSGSSVDYPFTLVNNLTEGGTDKALTAEQGKVIGQMLNGGDGVSIDVSSITSCGGRIASGAWTSANGASYYGGLIDISAYRGRTIKIIAGGTSSGGGSFAFTVNGFTNGQAVQYATGWSGSYLFGKSGDEWTGIVPDDAVYLYVYLQSTTTSYRPQSIEIAATNGINAKIQELEDLIENIDVSVNVNIDVESLTSCGGSISKGVWRNYAGYYGALIDVSKSRGETIKILANATGGSYTFLISGISVGNNAQYASGYSSVIVMSGNTEYSVVVPNDAVYLYVYLASPGVDYRPQAIAYVRELGEAFAGLEQQIQANSQNKLSVCTYNIGHFSGGSQKNSTITAAQYAGKVDGFRALLSTRHPDIFGITEYSAIFGKNASGNDVATKDELFNFQQSDFESSQLNYACYALFGGYGVPLYNIQINDFECLENETITHTTAITAQDYRYISADLYIFGVSVKLIVTHLAFDSNRPGVLQDAQISELIEKYDDFDFVIMMGDWNCSDQSHFDAFTQAGYTLANDGTFITYPSGGTALDNIVVKGLKIGEVAMISSTLSDHNPLFCEIYK